MTKLFQATGQLNERNAPKSAADTEVLLNEVHDRQPGSNEHLLAISRMNYLHSRFRKAGKILGEDMLHTLGSAVVDIFRSVDENKWWVLSEIEKCAIGCFIKRWFMRWRLISDSSSRVRQDGLMGGILRGSFASGRWVMRRRLRSRQSRRGRLDGDLWSWRCGICRAL